MRISDWSSTSAFPIYIATLRLVGWPSGIAIVLVADVLGALMMAVTSLLVLLSLVFAAATGEDDGHFVALALVLSTGVYGAMLTGDLFSLFVFVEVMLVPSYVLLIRSGGRRRLAAGQRYEIGSASRRERVCQAVEISVGADS